MLKNIFQIITSPQLQHAILPVKIVFYILSLSAVVLIIGLLFTTSYLRVLFGETWEDFLCWKHTYSTKALRKAKSRRKKEATVSSVSNPLAENKGKDEHKEEDINEELNFKNGRIERSSMERILDKLGTNNELNYKLAFIDADKLFDQALKNQGKKLSQAPVSNVDDILKAKQVLEKMLAHPEAKLTSERARELVEVYQKALSELS